MRSSLSLKLLSPAYFGMVMATGIVSIAAWQHQLEWIAQSLYALNLAFYVVLWLLYALRLFLHPHVVWEDIRHHSKAFGFFTLVAGTSVLGSQSLLLTEQLWLAIVLLCVAMALWLVCTYGIFFALMIQPQKPTLRDGLNGGWLLSVVATQSVAILSVLLVPHVDPALQRPLQLLAMAAWLWGGMLYVWLITLIVYRFFFITLSAQDITSPYWINMGAMAISSLAGSLLFASIDSHSALAIVAPIVMVGTLLYWVVGSWWIPLLLLLGVWRFGIKRLPFTYDSLYWSCVFPLGMYAACTYSLVRMLDVPFINNLSTVFLGAALLAWSLVTVGLLRRLLQLMKSAS